MLGGLSPIPGGASLGEWAGGLIARQFGVPATPEAVASAIVAAEKTSGAPEVASRLDAAESEAVARWEAEAEIAKANAADRTAQSQAINATMRAEVTAGVAWYHWRHLLGYVIGLWYVVPLPGLAYLFFRQDPALIAQVTTLLGAMSAFVLGGSALLGAVAWDTSRFKETVATGIPRQSAAAVVQKVAGQPAGRR
jgi:hypothetical protein